MTLRLPKHARPLHVHVHVHIHVHVHVHIHVHVHALVDVQLQVCANHRHMMSIVYICAHIILIAYVMRQCVCVEMSCSK